MVMIPKTVKELKSYMETFDDTDGRKLFVETTDDDHALTHIVAVDEFDNIWSLCLLPNLAGYDFAGNKKEVDSKT